MFRINTFRTLGYAEETHFDVLRMAELCRRYGVARLEPFGSVTRGEQRQNSDVDLLYTLERGTCSGGRSRTSPSLWKRSSTGPSTWSRGTRPWSATRPWRRPERSTRWPEYLYVREMRDAGARAWRNVNVPFPRQRTFLASFWGWGPEGCEKGTFMRRTSVDVGRTAFPHPAQVGVRRLAVRRRARLRRARRARHRSASEAERGALMRPVGLAEGLG